MVKTLLQQITCPHCGQNLPLIDHYDLKWTGVQRVVLEAIQRSGPHGISIHLLAARAALMMTDGEFSDNCVRTHVWRINRKLRQVGKMVFAGNTRPAFYRIVAFKEAKDGSL